MKITFCYWTNETHVAFDVALNSHVSNNPKKKKKKPNGRTNNPNYM